MCDFCDGPNLRKVTERDDQFKDVIEDNGDMKRLDRTSYPK